MISQVFEWYLIIYTIVAFAYLWYRYTFVLSKPKFARGDFIGKVSVIIPFYNEDPNLLTKTIISAHKCIGDKEIIVIDDGSPSKDTYNKISLLRTQIPFKLIRYEKNEGKRYAQNMGFEMASGDVIMTLDSDTILDKYAIFNLTRPFSDRRVGATTGQLRVINKDKNILTKMQASRYWNAFNFERKSQGALGVVVCCSGPISAYRKKVIDMIKGEYQNQCFLGRPCTYGDDRHLTSLVLKHKLNVVYISSAIGYTQVPEKFKNYVKQQIRWKKSYLRETLVVSKFMFDKRGFALPFEISLTTFLIFFSLFARIALIISLIMNPFYFLWVIPMILVMSTLNSLYILFYRPSLFINSLIYGFLHAFVVYWLIFVALFTLNDTKWGTR